MSKTWVVIAALLIGCFFFICAVFGAELGSMTELDEVAAGLLCVAAALTIERIP